MIEYDNETLVTIRCITYNHEPYIAQCLEGFVMQQTNFKFEAIVHDDASTDGTADIIRKYAEKYPDIIKPIYQTENQYSKRDGSIGRILNEHTRGKYIAICEGDDYWIDPLKLQKQVDFLETHTDYVLSYTNKKVINEAGKIIFTNKHLPDISNDTFKYLLYQSCPITTATVCFRKDVYDKVYKQIREIPFKLMMADYPLWLSLSQEGKFHYIDNQSVMYRLLKNSASHSTNSEHIYNFAENARMICRYYEELAELEPSNLIDMKYHYTLLRTMPIKFKGDFMRLIFKSVRNCPMIIIHLMFYKSILSSLIRNK